MKQDFITFKYTNETRVTSFAMKQQYNNKFKKSELSERSLQMTALCNT